MTVDDEITWWRREMWAARSIKIGIFALGVQYGLKIFGEMSMRRTTIDAILKAFKEQRDPINDSDLDGEQPITMLVTFSLGDLRSLKAIIHEADRMAERATKA